MTSTATADTSRTTVPRTVKGGARGLSAVAALVLRVWAATLRLEVAPELACELKRDATPMLFVLWHSRLFAASKISRRIRSDRRLHVLVSASKDGAWLADFFERCGLAVVRGSSSRGGREAVQALIGVLRAGADAGLTPDGPRGPAEVFKPGALVVARRSRARVILLGIDYDAAWRANSWDRLFLPKPFSRVTVRAQSIGADVLTGEEALGLMERRLRELNPEPDAGEPSVL